LDQNTQEISEELPDMKGLGGLSFLKDLTIFNYLSTGSILQNGGMPLNELAVVVGVGVAALGAALYVFQKRELAY
jgi:ABC-type transport system involved in multi-copper enzyme maturation permease subunit